MYVVVAIMGLFKKVEINGNNSVYDDCTVVKNHGVNDDKMQERNYYQ
jgi:hypothetical protein